MIKRNYYSVRTGKITPDQQVNFEVLKKLFSITYNKLNADGYFQKYFGIDCEDGYIQGEQVAELDALMFVNLRKDNLYPIRWEECQGGNECVSKCRSRWVQYH